MYKVVREENRFAEENESEDEYLDDIPKNRPQMKGYENLIISMPTRNWTGSWRGYVTTADNEWQNERVAVLDHRTIERSEIGEGFRTYNLYRKWLLVKEFYIVS